MYRIQLDSSGCLPPGPKLFGQCRHQPLWIEHGFIPEHEENGAGQLDGQDGVGFELVAVHVSLQALGQRVDEVMIAFGDNGGFAEGPAEVGIAELGAAQALDLAGAGDGAFDQAAVGHEIFDGGEAGDVADFVEDGGGEVLADAGDGLEQGIVTGGDLFGECLELGFDGGDLGVEVADHGELIFEGQLPNGVVFVGQELLFPRVAIGAGLADRGTVVGQLMGLDAGQQIGAGPDKEGALTKQGAQGAQGGGIDVGGRDEIGAQQVGEFFGIDAVVFVFAAMNGFDIKGVGQHEGQTGGLAGIGQPIPAEHAFGADGEVVAIRLDELEEEVEIVVSDVGVDEFLAVPIHEADVHLVGVEVDSAVELCGGGVILHNDHSMWGRETPVIVCSAGSVRYTPRPSPQMLTKNTEGFKGSIKSLQATRGGVSSSASRFTSTGPACLSSGH